MALRGMAGRRPAHMDGRRGRGRGVSMRATHLLSVTICLALIGCGDKDEGGQTSGSPTGDPTGDPPGPTGSEGGQSETGGASTPNPTTGVAGESSGGEATTDTPGTSNPG